MLCSAYDKAKLFTKTILGTLTLMTQGSLPIFPSRTNLKLHNISVTPQLVKLVCTVSPLSVVSNLFEKLINNKVVDHLEKCSLISDF